MVRICEVVQQVLVTGYLTVEAEDQLRLLLRTQYDQEDLNSFLTLQQAAMTGHIRQESRDLMHSQRLLPGITSTLQR